ncbi:MAG: replication factor C large subunit [Candidatus Aenigmatarchaeota archaeon]
MWVLKYKPKNLKEFVNQKEAVKKFLSWIENWKPGGKAMLFYGMPGVGKTALLEAYANEKNLELIQMNASDYRSAQQIREVIGSSMRQRSLFKKSKIFLIDEIDGIAGREDYGGVGEIIKIIKESIFPIILTANNPYDEKLRSLREYCILVEFKKIPVWDIEKRLGEICKEEKIKAEKEVLRNLAKMSDGDLRSCITDLEILARGKREIKTKDLAELSSREREENIFNVLKVIFKSKSLLASKLSLRNVDKDPDEIFWWIENNIAKEYEKPEEIARAFEILSKADLLRSFVISRQNWKLKGYMIDLMTGGVALAKRETYRKFTKYQYPSKITILGRSKVERKEKREIFQKLSKNLHCSTRKIKNEFLPFFKLILKNSEMRKKISQSLSLSQNEMDLLK